MYTQFFRLSQAPFSISPDPRYLFMSERHREALAHLLYGVDSGGGVVVLTGDIGTGKTTICRCFLEQVPSNCNVAYIFNPRLTAIELLQTVCEEFRIDIVADDGDKSTKRYIDALNRFLLAAHAAGRNSVLIIDEAQNLSPGVLEQLRLLTNLETNERKLLQIILIGQPELRAILAQPDLEQLAQRIIANYHLTALSEAETASYIQHRLAAAGLTGASPFPAALTRQIHRLTAGVPRRINLLCDRALLGAYANGLSTVDRRILDGAARELFVSGRMREPAKRRVPVLAATLLALALGGAAGWAAIDAGWLTPPRTAQAGAATQATLAVAGTDAARKPEAAAASAPGPAVQAAAAPAEPPTEAEGPLTSEAEAIRLLARLWGGTLAGDDPCGSAPEHGLRCHWSTGGIPELRRLDRPAALKLRDDSGKSYFALLTRLDEASATLRIGAQRKPVSVVALARQFDGVFVTLWRPPPGFNAALKMEDKGPAVDWIAERLAGLAGEPAPAAGRPFDQKLLRQVLQFQQASGLAADGIVGAVTAMQINRAAGIAEPRLLASLQGASPSTE
ncbi:ExeA family protein [Noviherbaspirillum aridicola]|uniref:ATPase AAA n=1 Tax=Noviherbaspirillum aridicola TaxID=2849687 RepID=A0ABQ4PYQ8_9BURK|nr:ExeA family protein [Noviherbaspirillum aridicola]GIZ50037.1 ATPase AAA [Noviherbaspirillum aridicola]